VPQHDPLQDEPIARRRGVPRILRRVRTYTHNGRIELAGQIYAFTVPLDGTAGTIGIATDQSPLNRSGVRVQVITAAPVTPHPTVAPAPARVELPRIEPAFLIGGAVVLVTIVGAYVDRRRSLARSLTA